MKTYFILALRIIAAAIMLQTLFFKFTAAPESVYIFNQMGIEPVGRIGTGVLELIAAFLLLNARTSWIGAIISAIIMIGAIVVHVFIIGIDVLDDNGKLFSLAIITFICSLFLIYEEKEKILFFIRTQVFNF